MSSSEFAFVPRKLTRPEKDKRTIGKELASDLRSQVPKAIPTETNVTVASKELPGVGKKKWIIPLLEDSSYVSLLEISLSEHSIWSSSDLSDRMSKDEHGYISLSYLLRTSPLFRSLKPDQIPSESVLLRCVKSSNLLEGRMIVPNMADGRNGMNNSVEGGYEVRRKDWSVIRDRLHKHTPFFWKSRTIYFENIPHSSWTIPALVQLIKDILPLEYRATTPIPIQGISFPPHRNDSPSSPPPAKSRGFAFVILDQISQVDAVLASWPWNISGTDSDKGDQKQRTKLWNEARESGLRCLTMRHWEKLKEEYLTLQQTLLKKTLKMNVQDSIPGFSSSNFNLNTENDTTSLRLNKSPVACRMSPKPEDDVQVSSISSLDQELPYPPDCLVFVKNINPDTNKTTLRTLFSKIIDGDKTDIDYVDFNKGLDSCYLRLTSSDAASSLVTHFEKHQLAQANALDNDFTSSNDNLENAIKVELMQGSREALYWEKVPEKVRKAALIKVGGIHGATRNSDHQEFEAGDTGNGRKRKRRRY